MSGSTVHGGSMDSSMDDRSSVDDRSSMVDGTGNCDGVGNSVGDTVANQDLGGSRGSSEDCSKANEGLKYAISQKVKADSFLFSVSPSFCSVQVFWID